MGLAYTGFQSYSLILFNKLPDEGHTSQLQADALSNHAVRSHGCGLTFCEIAISSAASSVVVGTVRIIDLWLFLEYHKPYRLKKESNVC